MAEQRNPLIPIIAAVVVATLCFSAYKAGEMHRGAVDSQADASDGFTEILPPSTDFERESNTLRSLQQIARENTMLKADLNAARAEIDRLKRRLESYEPDAAR